MSVTHYTRITELESTDETDIEDELPIVRKSDLEMSPDGSDRKITSRRLVERASIRPSNNLTVSKRVAEWVAEFRDSINGLNESTEQATTVKAGTVKMASDTQARNKESITEALSPSNLAALVATDEMHGLLRAGNSDDVDIETEDAAITPALLLGTILGAAILGENSNVFKFPSVDPTTNDIVYLTVQYGEQSATGAYTITRPESSPNHTHPFIDIGVTFPEPFENKCLMVIPMGYDVSPDYDEGTDYFFRTRRQDLSTAVIRGSRIAGINDSGEIAGVRYIAVGY